MLKDVEAVILAQALTNCGHFIPEEQPEAAARELASFFGEV
jgi:pimeloyl-ACP methyl ester carboxylesterase